MWKSRSPRPAKVYKLYKNTYPREVKLHQIMRRMFATRTLAFKLVSVITLVTRDTQRDTIFANFDRQRYPNKELIIILYDKSLDLQSWKENCAESYNVQIYQLSETLPPGDCLKFALHKSSGNYIARFAEDCYYAANYLSDLVNCFFLTEAGIVGKLAHCIYFENTQQLTMYNGGKGYNYVEYLPVNTQLVRREVFQCLPKVVDQWDNEPQFCQTVTAAGIRLYAADPFNFLTFDRPLYEVSPYTLLGNNWLNEYIDDNEFIRRYCTILIEKNEPISLISV